MRGRRSLGAATVALSVALCLVLAGSGPVVGAVRAPLHQGQGGAAAAPIDQSKITFQAFRSFGYPIVPGEPFFLEVTKRVPTGPMHFAELVDGSEVFLGDASWQFGGAVDGVQILIADWVIDPAIEGTRTYLAVFEATPDFDSLTLSLEVVVALATLTITIIAANPVQTHHEVSLAADIQGAGTGVPMTGQFEWRDGGALVATRSADDYPVTLAPLALGVHPFTLTYTGDDVHAASTSPVFALTVVPDVVDATGVGPQYPTFYPVTDGYRDTVPFKGTRAEPISVVIGVYSPSDILVRSFSLPAGTGVYSQVWNGRNAAGTILPAGRYRIVQDLTDGYAIKKRVTSYVTLSLAKLVQYTTDVTLAGSALSASGSGGGGSVVVSSTGGYTKLTAGSGWADAGWEFHLPNATVYNSVSVRLYAKGGFSVPPTYLGLQNFTTCPRGDSWDETCFEQWTVMGNASNTLVWYATPAVTSRAYRSDAYVRGLIAVEFGTMYVYQARARVVYQVLEPVTGVVVVPPR